MTTIYVDNAATTQLSDTALEAMKPMMQEIYGNPSSLHHIGQIAKEHLEDARARAAKCINANPNEIYFTSGGSEADNQAIITAAYNGAKKVRSILFLQSLNITLFFTLWTSSQKRALKFNFWMFTATVSLRLKM